MAKKKEEVCSETISINLFGTGYTVSAGRWYVGGRMSEEFQEVYIGRLELIRGLAKYLRLGVVREERPRIPGMLSIFEIPGLEKVA